MNGGGGRCVEEVGRGGCRVEEVGGGGIVVVVEVGMWLLSSFSSMQLQASSSPWPRQHLCLYLAFFLGTPPMTYLKKLTQISRNIRIDRVNMLVHALQTIVSISGASKNSKSRLVLMTKSTDDKSTHTHCILTTPPPPSPSPLDKKATLATTSRGRNNNTGVFAGQGQSGWW